MGQTPVGIAFDGANIWVANFGDGTVTKLRASDGTTLGTFKWAAPPMVSPLTGPIFGWRVVADGVTKLRASDGLILGTFKVGGIPSGVAFDGANVWVASGGRDMLPSCGLRTAPTWERSMWAPRPTGVAFDGANIWVTNLTGGDRQQAVEGGNYTEGGLRLPSDSKS